MTTDPRIRTLAEARQQVGIDTGRTFAWDDLNPIEQGNALAVAAAWLEAAVAAGIAPPAAVPVPPPADQTALRDRLADALYRHEWPGKQVWVQALAMDREVFEAMADAVLAVLPEQTDRAAVLRWAADELGRMDYDTDSNDYGYDTYRDAWNGGVMDAAALLRRVAAEEQSAEHRKRPLTLSTPCAVCKHPYNWHTAGGCQADGCGCITFAVDAETVVGEQPETQEALRCVCGDPVQLMDEADPTSWIHSPGSDTRCLDARPRCPHCQMPHDLTPGMSLACASIRASIRDRDTAEAPE